MFGIGLGMVSGFHNTMMYFTGYVTEFSLSVDNVFVFIILIKKFEIPNRNQRKVMTVGIAIALISRVIFILLGISAIHKFSWISYLLGIILFIAAIKTLKKEDEEAEVKETALSRTLKKHLRHIDNHDTDKIFPIIDGKRWTTPLFFCILSIGSMDIMFSIDSIPAVLGITHDTYIVLMVNFFALLGLRQVYFLVKDAINKIDLLSYALAIILVFIGVKTIFTALHENTLPFINGGHAVNAPVISIPFSLGFIVVVLVLAVVIDALRKSKWFAKK
jgi:tellurite resistance protein TerC